MLENVVIRPVFEPRKSIHCVLIRSFDLICQVQVCFVANACAISPFVGDSCLGGGSNICSFGSSKSISRLKLSFS